MTIESKKDAGKLTLTITGRLDTSTAPKLEETLKGSYDGVTELVFDLKKLEYISSAGLRVLLGATQAMEDKGEMVVRNLTPSVKEVFELTGFSRLFAIE